MPRLDPLPRGSTAQQIAPGDEKVDTYRCTRYANDLTADEQDLIDDIGAVMRSVEEMAEAARATILDLVWSLIISNPTLLSDSTALFHADHGNSISDTLTADGVGVALDKLGSQRLDGRPLNLGANGFALIVPSALAMKARTIREGLDDPSLMRLHIEDRISTAGTVDPLNGTPHSGSSTNWYLAGLRRTLQVAVGGPVVRDYVMNRGQWGMGWKIKLDAGAGIEDYRALVYSSGAGS